MSWQCFNLLQIIWQAITVWLLFVSNAWSCHKLQLSANIFVLQCIWFNLGKPWYWFWFDVDTYASVDIYFWLLVLVLAFHIDCWLLIFLDNHAALLVRATGTVAEKRITGTVVLVILICLGILGTFERDPLPYILNWRFSTNIHQIIHYPPQIFWQPFSLILHKPRPYYNENINGREILTKNHW